MRLTYYTDYGLRMLMRMAGEPSRAFTTAEFALELGLSRNHLTKILGTLAKAGIVQTQRGSGGGAVLARPADAIRLGDVIAILEKGQVLVECFDPQKVCSIEGCCRLKARLRLAERAFLDSLNRSSLADCAISSNVFPIRAADAPLPSRVS